MHAATLLLAVIVIQKEEWKPAEDAGTIRGTVKLDGTAPPRKKICVGDKYAELKHPDGLFSESIVVGKNGGLQNCVVCVKKGVEDFKFEPPRAPIVLTFDGCVMVPHTFGIMVGQDLRIENKDETGHNVHLSSPEYFY